VYRIAPFSAVNGVSTEAFRRGWTPVFLPRDVALVDIKSLNLGCGVIVDPQGDESLLRMLIAARWPVLTTGRVVNLDHQADVLSIDNDVVAVTKSALGGANEIVIRHLTRQTAPRYRSRDRAVNRHSRCLWRRCHSDLDHVSGEMDIQLCWRKWRRRAGR
jgi:hypothetical protein